MLNAVGQLVTKLPSNSVILKLAFCLTVCHSLPFLPQNSLKEINKQTSNLAHTTRCNLDVDRPQVPPIPSTLKKKVKMPLGDVIFFFLCLFSTLIISKKVTLIFDINLLLQTRTASPSIPETQVLHQKRHVLNSIFPRTPLQD